MNRSVRRCMTAVATVMLCAVPVAARAVPAPLIRWSPATSFDYGFVTPGDSVVHRFTLTNRGGAASGALTVTLSGSSQFTKVADGCTEQSLGPGVSCAVRVRFAPSTAGERETATLTAQGKKAAANATVSLAGTGAGEPDLAISPGFFLGTTDFGMNRYRFGFASSSITDQTFTISNAGTGATNALRLTVGAADWFTLANDTCNDATLQPNDTCTFDLVFTPQSCDVVVLTAVSVYGAPRPDPYLRLNLEGTC